MKTPIYLLFLIVTMLCISASCNKVEMPDSDPGPQPKTELPPATKTGANTFGFVLNDTTNWVSELFPITLYLGVNGNTDLWGAYLPSSGFVKIKANREYSDDDVFEYYVDESFIIEGYYQEGTFEIDYYGPNDAIYKNYANGIPNCGCFNLDTLNDNQVTITHLDTINRIISGIFDLKGKERNSNCQDSIVFLSNGRFDISY